MLSEDFPALLVGVRAGSVVAGYRLEEQVGTGGMAVVFRARDERLGRRVALKILAPPLAADPAFRRRFIAESRAAAADDPHVIPIYEAGEAAPETAFYEFSAANGKLARTLARWAVSPSVDVLWSNPSGSVLIGVASLNGNAEVGMITAGTFTPLHGLGPEDQSDQGAW